jgi:hypothetical protein
MMEQRRRTRMARASVVAVLVMLGWWWVSGAASADEVGTGQARSADAAFWTRVVLEGQERVHRLTGEYVPLPEPSRSPEPSGDGASTREGASTGDSEPSTHSEPSTSSGGSRGVPSAPASGAGAVGGWYAGATGQGVLDGDFAAWLGQPIGVVGTWNDTTAEVQSGQPSLTGELAGWKGAIDIAVAGTVLGSGETYARAARGDFDQRWKQAAATIAEARKGATGPTFVRPWHEFNGDWYGEWAVNAQTVEDYRAAFRRFAGILEAAMPGLYVVWSPNDGNHQDLPVSQMYPGDDVVDVIAPDSYDWTGSSQIDQAAVRQYMNRSDGGEPAGVETWRQFAQRHGKPMGLPEWGLCSRSGCGGDHPAYVEAMNAWMTENANTATWQLGQPIPRQAAGKLLYSIYFNTVHQGDRGFLIRGGPNARSSEVFRQLRWGTAR